MDDIEKEVNNNLNINIIKLLCHEQIDEPFAKAFINNDETLYHLKNIVEEDLKQDEWDYIESSNPENDKYFNERYEELTKYINENPNDPEGYFNRGYMQSCYDVENEVVLSDYDKAIELNPNYIDAIRCQMYLFEQMGEYEKTIYNCSKLVELESVWDNYCLYIRYLVDYANDYQKALEICNKAFKLFEPDAQMYAQRGGVFYHMNEYDKAIADYKKAIELDSEEDYWRVVLKQIEQENQENL